MNYLLYAAGDLHRPLAQAMLDNNFQAEQWARKWVLADGDGDDFVLKRADGGFEASVFRTLAGQCYVMAKVLPA